MASSEKVVMNLEDFEGSDGTVRHAMDIWSARRGPIKYNQWQSLYFGLVRSGFKDSEAVEDKINRLYKTGSVGCVEKFNRNIMEVIMQCRRLSRADLCHQQNL